MNSKQRKTLEAIFSTPVPKTLAWKDIESLFRALGCTVVEGDGSRVSFRSRFDTRPKKRISRRISTGRIRAKKPSRTK